MTFGSIFFIAVFLPVATCGHWLLQLAPPRLATRAANVWLLLVSILACALSDLDGLPVFLLCAIATDAAARAIHRCRGERARTAIATAAVAFNLAMLCAFKYGGFTERLVAALRLAVPAPRIVIPLGMSFWVFRAISYVLDVRRGVHPPARSPVAFLCWMALFPIFVSGPIVRWNDVSASFENRPFRAGLVASGFRRLFVGMAKKTLVANTLAQFADAVWTIAEGGHAMGPRMALLGIAAYSLQLYFDFSGYSDMAIGIGRMLGFNFRENFLWPYSASSIRDFWRKWHISLSTWFRDYLYIPLGGSRVSQARACLNGLVVFTLCGVWHGVGLPFAVWGLWHGLLICAERLLGPARQAPNATPPRRRPVAAALRSLAAHGYALAAVSLGWVFFRSPDFPSAIVVLKSMLGLAPMAREARTLWLDCTPLFTVALATAVVFCLPVVPAARRLLRKAVGATTAWALESAAASAMLAVSVLFMASGTRQAFLYFKF